MGMRKNQSKSRFTNTIKRLFLEINQVDGDKRLRLVVERDGSKYPDWYSCGDARDIKLNAKGTKWTPADYSFPGKSLAMWYMNALFEAAEKAEVPFDDGDLESFWGMRVQTEERTYKTKVKGQSIEREKPFPVMVFTGDEDGPSTSAPAPTANGTSELAETLQKLLESNNGEIEVSAINARSLKGVVDADYTTRRALAVQLTSEAFLNGVDGVNYEDGVASLA